MIPYITITFLILVVVLWFWAIWDLSIAKFRNRNSKLFWFLAILIFPVLGSIVYFQVKNRLVSGKREFRPDFESLR